MRADSGRRLEAGRTGCKDLIWRKFAACQPNIPAIFQAQAPTSTPVAAAVPKSSKKDL